jgi:uncharacterized iron-regulated membrane protein
MLARLGIGIYVLVLSVSGSVIVYRNELSRTFAVEGLVKLHENLLFGNTGRPVNGIGALFLTLVCLTGAVICWPGIKNWRRSLTVKWNTRFARFSWDLHSALGFWTFPSFWCGAFQGSIFPFRNSLTPCSPSSIPVTGSTTEVCFGSLTRILADSGVTEAVWSFMGLVLALLSISDVFVCCHQLVYKKSANPNRQTE